MVILSLSTSVEFYFQQGLAPTSHQIYNAAHKQFYRFCIQFNLSHPFPVTENILCSFASFLADKNLAPQTIKSYLSAIRSMQISLGLPDPRDNSSLPRLRRVLAGIQRVRSEKGVVSRTRLPITATVLQKIHDCLMPSQHPEKHVLWAVACTAFFGFFRLGELLPESANAYKQETHLSWGDVAVDSHDNPKMVQIHLKKVQMRPVWKGCGCRGWPY